MLWKDRFRLVRVFPMPSWWGLTILLLAMFLLLGGVLGSELFLARISLLVMIAGLVVLFLRLALFSSCALPLDFSVSHDPDSCNHL